MKNDMTPPTDERLKQILAEMLPDVLHLYGNDSTGMRTLFWKDSIKTTSPQSIRVTELLHLCWLVEETIIVHFLRKKYTKLLGITTNWELLPFNVIHASWQQRVMALANVKGITI